MTPHAALALALSLGIAASATAQDHDHGAASAGQLGTIQFDTTLPPSCSKGVRRSRAPAR